MYIIIKTVKDNSLVVEIYLKFLFDILANSDNKSREALLDVMSWSSNLIQELKLLLNKYKFKTPVEK